ncbi:MAG: hypothetical protein DRO96_01245 [Candidatus Aenigmatarchaeota archaeon]|nr:MAG: hypothetical protein DRO96_01245 [Candidatus Aenigmarchaeota archaeon]
MQKMVRWDEKNRPIGYILGVTPGFAEFEQGADKLTYMGLARKLTKAARLGFQFAQIDFEALSEMFEPDIAKQVEEVKRVQGLEVGVHLPTQMDLCLADAFQWLVMQEQLAKGTEAAADIMKAKYMLFHSSSTPRPNLTPASGQRTYPSKMVAWNGMNLGDWIESVGTVGGVNLKDWFMARFVRVLFHAMGAPADVGMVTFFEDLVINKKKYFKEGCEIAEREAKRLNEKITQMAKERVYKKKKPIIDALDRIKDSGKEIEKKIVRGESITPEEHKIYKEYKTLQAELSQFNIQEQSLVRDEADNILDENPELHNEYKKYFNVYRYNHTYNFYDVFKYWKENGSECEEAVAYHVIAKWMWLIRDPLYVSIVDNQEDPDKIIYEANIKMGREGKLTEDVKQIICAVAAKYIEGHLKAKGEGYGIPLKDEYGRFIRNKNGEIQTISPMEYAKKHNLHIFIETNMPPKGHEGELRIMRATDHIKIVKCIDPENMSYCMDFEHLTLNYISPEEEAEKIIREMPGDAKYIRCVHINAPRPIAGAHAPLPQFSYDIYIIYRHLYKLKQAGMNNAYWIWEMGSYGVKSTAKVFYQLYLELVKNPPTNPEELPMEAFGMSKNMLARQRAAIMLHAMDPIKDLLAVPEEHHTFFSKAAIEKGKGAEWARQEFY